MSELPKGWVQVTLEDIAIWSSGGTPSRSNPGYYAGSIPWLKTGELGPQVIYKAEEHISDAAILASSAKVFPKGSVAIAMYGATIGRTSTLGIDAATNQACAVGIPDATSTDFLYYFLVSQEKRFVDAGKGGAQPNISQGIVKAWPIALPPSAEQTRIVAKLEELLEGLDAGIAELKAAQRKLAQYRQSLLKAAVEGALTAEWRQHNRPTETGAQLLERILTERHARWEARQLAKFKEQGKIPPKDWQKKYPEPAQPDTAELPELPEGWAWASVDQLVAESSYGTSVKCNYESNGTPVLRIPNVSGGSLDLRDMKFSVADLELGKDAPLAVGDVLVVRTNGSISLVGRAAAVVNELPIPHYFASYLLRLRCTEITYVHRWILAVLTAHTGRQWLEARAASSAGQHNISLSTLLTMPVPLPPLNEQLVALKEVEGSHKSIERQEQAVELALKQSTAQRQNILRAAFSGQLVPQDPADEPAGVLLERIRSERAAQRGTPTRRGRKKETA